MSESEVQDTNGFGLCQCGCGNKTTVYYGKPRIFCMHHHSRGKNHYKWKGSERFTDNLGYEVIKIPNYPKANNRGYVREHIVIAERVLGKPLPPGVQIHHHGIKREQHIVICQDRAYHNFIEQRTRAFFACGHADWKKCVYCKQWDDPANMYLRKNRGGSAHHRKCNNIRQLQIKRRGMYALQSSRTNSFGLEPVKFGN